MLQMVMVMGFFDSILGIIDWIMAKHHCNTDGRCDVNNKPDPPPLKLQITDSGARILMFGIFYLLLIHAALVTEEQLAVTFLVYM